MSNYYISKCCGEQVTPKETIPGIKWNYVCLGCHQKCEVTAMLDTPGGVPKEGKCCVTNKDEVVKLMYKEFDMCSPDCDCGYCNQIRLAIYRIFDLGIESEKNKHKFHC